MSDRLNRVRCVSATTGQGSSVAIGAAFSAAYLTPVEAGAVDGIRYTYIIQQGLDIEIQEQQVWTAAGTTMARGTPTYSKIGGTAGTTKINLDASQQISFGPSAADMMFAVTHGADIASGSTVDLETSTGGLIDVTGTSAITAITLLNGHERTVRFTGALTLTHGSSLLLPGAANMPTSAGDFAIFRGYGSGVVRCVAYTKVSGKAVVPPAFSEVSSSPTTLSGYGITDAVPTSYLDTDNTLAADSDVKVATQKAVKAFVPAQIAAYVAAQDVEIFKGSIDCSANPNYPAADAGHVYRVSVAGKIGGASGAVVEASDRLECLVDSTSSGTQAGVGANWMITQANIDGALVSGGALGTPSSGNASNLTSFPTLNQNTTGSAATLTTSRNIDGQAFNGSTNITVIAPGTTAATSKTTPVDADEVPLVDSAAANVLKKLTWNNLKATLIATAMTWTGIQTITNSCLKLLGSSAGATTFTSDNASATNYTVNIPAENMTVGFRNVPQNEKNTAYTFTAADSGKHIFHSEATTTRTYTVPAYGTWDAPLGTAITIVNRHGSGVLTIAAPGGSEVLYLAGAGTTGNKTLAADGIATMLRTKTGSTGEWVISGTGLT